MLITIPLLIIEHMLSVLADDSSLKKQTTRCICTCMYIHTHTRVKGDKIPLKKSYLFKLKCS